MVLWQKIICRSVHLPSKKVNTNDIGNLSQTLYQNILFEILELIFNELEMFVALFTEIDKSWLDKNSDLILLYDIIQGRLSLNILQLILVKEVLSHIISNKRCWCQDKAE